MRTRAVDQVANLRQRQLDPQERAGPSATGQTGPDHAAAARQRARRRPLLLDDRVGTRATLITSQLAVSAWHSWLDEPTIADAILDRIVHSSHRIELKGPSLRKAEVPDTPTAP